MIITADVETYWSTEYTLSKLTTEAYVRSPLFKLHMIGLKIDDGETLVLTDAQFRAALDNGLRQKMAGAYLLCQNTAFDGFVLAHHYQVIPALYLDSMSMFRMVYPDRRASLAEISRTLGLEQKGGATGYSVTNTKGKEYLNPYEWNACAAYCKLDVDLAYQAFQILKSEFPVQELKLIDATIRMFTQPILRLNPEPLVEELRFEREKKNELLERVGQDKTVLSSSVKFAALLGTLGITPPVKPSPTALKKDRSLHERVMGLKADGIKLTIATCEEHDIPWSYAFGKSDTEFKHLLNHDDPMVIAAVEARLGVKSTISETRAARFYDASQRGAFPIPLAYWGAATGRWSGVAYNVQNLPRGSRLREAIIAPDGYMLVVCDYSSVEARVLAWLAGQDDLMELFRRGEDVYCDMATKIYGRRITKENKKERHVGKATILGSGYSMGWRKFQEYVTDTAKITFNGDDADQMGVDVGFFIGKPINAKFVRAACPSFVHHDVFATHCAVCEYIITAYRNANYMITRLWAEAGAALRYIHDGVEVQVGVPEGIVTTNKKGFAFPMRRMVRYTELEPKQNKNRTEWTRRTRDGVGYLSPGLCVENIVQALSRHIMADQMMVLVDEGYKVAFTCHDEIVLVVREAEAEAALHRMESLMSTPPEWADGCPIGCEGSTGRSYAEAK